MTKLLLLQTGVGYLVADYKIWGKENLMNIQRLKFRWRSVSRAERVQKQEVLHTIPKDLKPLCRRRWCKGSSNGALAKSL